MYDILYNCDPDKNTECSKHNCFLNGGDCHKTHKVQYALEPDRVTMVFPHTEENAALISQIKKGDKHDKRRRGKL